MTSLVFELQRDCSSGSVSVLDLLRKSLMVATKLDIQEFQDWINNELSGYENELDLPKYRWLYCELKAFNPEMGWIPVKVPNPEISKIISTATIV